MEDKKKKKKLLHKTLSERLAPSFHPSTSVSTTINPLRELSREQPRGGKRVERGTEGEGLQSRDAKPQQRIIKTLLAHIFQQME